MWRIAAATFLGLGLALGSSRASDAGSAPVLDSPPNLTSSYQSYNLKLSTFYPRPNRAGGIILHVRINDGRPLRLLLDSGADLLVINAKAGRSLGISPESAMELVGMGTKPAKMGRAGTVAIGPVSFRNCPVALMDGNATEGADGVIPLSLFSNFLLRLDLPEKTLGLTPYPQAETPEIPPTRGVVAHHLLLVEAVLNGRQSGYVALDTGAYCSAISPEVARTLNGYHDVREVRLASGTGAATGKKISSPVHFAIANQDVVPNEVVALDLSNVSRHYGVELMGVLGFPALAHYVLTIDYRGGRVKIEPRHNTSTREPDRGLDAKPPAPLAFR